MEREGRLLEFLRVAFINDSISHLRCTYMCVCAGKSRYLIIPHWYTIITTC